MQKQFFYKYKSYLKIRQKEVLDFARFLAERSQQEEQAIGKRQPNLLKGQVKIIDEDWHKPSVDIEEDFYK